MTIDDLLKKWLDREGGAERANYQMFLGELTQALGLPTPDPKGVGLGDYEFEAPVKSEAALGKKGTGRIDLYKRGCFILEAKQSQLKPGETAPAEPVLPPPEPIRDLFGDIVGYDAPAKLAPRYDRLMADARLQAERYALALPGDHNAPPFLIVADIGRSFELYFDWSGNGRGYAPFPDERHYRVALSELASDALLPGVELAAADVLRGIWTDPASIDPRLRAAAVTRDIAELLSRVASQLEQEQRARKGGKDDPLTALGIEATSLFLMRTLFCMFAEDVELLEKDSFKRFLDVAQGRTEHFWRTGLEQLWRAMNQPDSANRYWPHGDAFVAYFNGNLFAGAQVFDLPDEGRNILRIAAGKDWRKVEPAIFGTLLEQVLTPADRAKLGAHYTPRAYVERLVEAVILDVLRPEWEAALAGARARADAGDAAGAIADARAFHERLAEVRVLDPACGTGNFLYVAMEQLLRLEGEVRQFAAGLGAEIAPAVHPNQFLGLELNPRAAVIAELVLWIGWLRYRLANTPAAIGEPVLPTLTNINGGTHGGYDAVLVRSATGEPDTENPRRPEWPAADFIVGNPPFIGKGAQREYLGDAYLQALWQANPRVPKSADFVMQWWDRAADLLTREGTRLRRFGFVTTNSITQVFSRRVIEGWLAPALPSPSGEALGVGAASLTESSEEDSPHPNPSPEGEGLKKKLHLVLAIPDHPWTKVGKDAAAVRIAMTVADAGAGIGTLIRIIGERRIDSDAPELDEEAQFGTINADLTIGANATRLTALRANEGLSSNGMLLAGSGFVLASHEAEAMVANGKGEPSGILRPFLGGAEVVQHPQNRTIIDFARRSENDAASAAPFAFQHLLKTVRPQRLATAQRSITSDAKDYAARWWQFAKPREALRSALKDTVRYLVTVETAKHRIFRFVTSDTIADHMVIAIALETDIALGVLSSRAHTDWALALGATLEDRPRYSKSRVFDPFPFPAATPEQSAAIALLAERLDTTRKAALAEDEKLTMTGLYNLVAAIRDGSLDPKDEAKAVRARARIVAKLHDDLDAAVAAAYGWEWPLPPAEIVARLVALNAERAAEEKAGHVRWLRPDYQIPRFGA